MAAVIRGSSPCRETSPREKKPAVPGRRMRKDRKWRGETSVGDTTDIVFFAPWEYMGGRVKNDVSVQARWENEHVEFEIGI